MNDHNLDDLIIDNINPKNSKSKSILTIIALSVIVLIIAIILTKTLLKDPNETLVADTENDTEMISPELTLQSAIEEETKEKKLSLDTNIPTKTEKLSLSKTKQDTKKEEASQPNTSVKKPKRETDSVSEKPKLSTKKDTTVQITKPDIENEIKEKDLNEDEKSKKIVKITPDIFEEENLQIEKEDKVSKQTQEKPKKTEQKSKIKKIAKKTEPETSIKVTHKPNSQKPAKKLSKTGQYYIQVGSFRQNPSKHFLSIIKKSGFNYKISPSSSLGMKKLLIGPYPSKSAADASLLRVKDRINKGAFVIKK